MFVSKFADELDLKFISHKQNKDVGLSGRLKI